MTFERPRRGAVRAQTTVKVDVAPVPGEVEEDNNSAEYQVIFSLPVAAVHVSGNVAALIAVLGVVARDRRRSSSRCIAWVRVRRLRDAQRMLIGGGRKDLVEFAVSLQGRIDDLHRAVDEIAAGLARVDRRVDDLGHEHGDRPLRRLRGHGRPPVRLARAARRGPHGHRRHRDPGPRLRADLHEGARARQAVGRALARGAGGRRPRDGPIARRDPKSVRESVDRSGTFQPPCSRFWS